MLPSNLEGKNLRIAKTHDECKILNGKKKVNMENRIEYVWRTNKKRECCRKRDEKNKRLSSNGQQGTRILHE